MIRWHPSVQNCRLSKGCSFMSNFWSLHESPETYMSLFLSTKQVHVWYNCNERLWRKDGTLPQFLTWRKINGRFSVEIHESSQSAGEIVSFIQLIPPKTNVAPENGLLEDLEHKFPFGKAYFQGLLCCFSGVYLYVSHPIASIACCLWLFQDCSYIAGRTFIAGRYDQRHLVRVVHLRLGYHFPSLQWLDNSKLQED